VDGTLARMTNSVSSMGLPRFHDGSLGGDRPLLRAGLVLSLVPDRTMPYCHGGFAPRSWSAHAPGRRASGAHEEGSSRGSNVWSC
jgi:hypothetical protein